MARTGGRRRLSRPRRAAWRCRGCGCSRTEALRRRRRSGSWLFPADSDEALCLPGCGRERARPAASPRALPRAVATPWADPPLDPATARALEAAARRYPRGNADGVRGYALRRPADGSPPELVVFRAGAAAARSRRGATEAPLEGLRLRFRELGEAPRLRSSAARFTGVHPGAAVLAASQTGSGEVRRWGGIACLAEADDGGRYAVTAGHLFLPGASSGVLLAASPGGEPPAPIGRLVLDQLDSPPPRLGFGLDGALVELNDLGRELADRGQNGQAVEGGAAGPEALDGRSALALLPTRGEVSPRADTAYPGVFYPEDRYRGAYEVRGVVAAMPGYTLPGDSGTLLFGEAAPHLGLGVCVGLDLAGPSVFEPLARLLFHAAEQLGRQLTVWIGT